MDVQAVIFQMAMSNKVVDGLLNSTVLRGRGGGHRAGVEEKAGGEGAEGTGERDRAGRRSEVGSLSTLVCSRDGASCSSFGPDQDT